MSSKSSPRSTGVVAVVLAGVLALVLGLWLSRGGGGSAQGTGGVPASAPSEPDGTDLASSPTQGRVPALDSEGEDDDAPSETSDEARTSAGGEMPAEDFLRTYWGARWEEVRQGYIDNGIQFYREGDLVDLERVGSAEDFYRGASEAFVREFSDGAYPALFSSLPPPLQGDSVEVVDRVLESVAWNPSGATLGPAQRGQLESVVRDGMGSVEMASELLCQEIGAYIRADLSGLAPGIEPASGSLMVAPFAAYTTGAHKGVHEDTGSSYPILHLSTKPMPGNQFAGAYTLWLGSDPVLMQSYEALRSAKTHVLADIELFMESVD